MREIKFRAWSESTKRYSKPFGVQYNVLNFTNDDGMGVVKSLSNEIVEQYTSLKDKNGNEIYEGDICQTWFGETVLEVVIIVNRHGAFWDKNPHSEDYNNLHSTVRPYQHDMGNSSFYEIIGNIHENKDLLK